MIRTVHQPLAVTPAIKKKLEKLGIHRRIDLVLHLPLRYEDETRRYPIAKVPYVRWLKWVAPLLGILTVLIVVCLSLGAVLS